jgi:transposase
MGGEAQPDAWGRGAAREGVLKGRARRVDVPSRPAREIKQLQALRREHAMLKEEHELLRKAIRFSSARRRRSSRSSTASDAGVRSARTSCAARGTRP